LVVSTAVLLIAGGVFACAPLFKQISKGLERLFVFLGFIVGIGIIVVTIYAALNLTFLSTILGTGLVPAADAFPYAQYYLVVMAVLGILLFSRPLRNVRWASLISLGIAILAAAELHIAFGGLTTVELGIVFIIVLLIVYTLLRFVEDILEFIGSVLAFPPVAIVIGLVSIYFGIVAYNSHP
jgi:hypothetical protein